MLPCKHTYITYSAKQSNENKNFIFNENYTYKSTFESLLRVANFILLNAKIQVVYFLIDDQIFVIKIK